jgi:hypothetical protein
MATRKQSKQRLDRTYKTESVAPAWIENRKAKYGTYKMIHEMADEPVPPNCTEVGFIVILIGPFTLGHDTTSTRRTVLYTDGEIFWETERVAKDLLRDDDEFYANEYQSGLMHQAIRTYLNEAGL